MSRLFISHASEDKNGFVEPLAIRLQQRGHEVWYDKCTLTLGDSLSREIDAGLVDCDYGIVVLSPRFFAKSWPRAELDALVSRETAEDRKRILPIWYDVSLADVQRYSPLLASRLAVSTEAGMDLVVDEIERAVARQGALIRGSATTPQARVPQLSAWQISMTAPSLQSAERGESGLLIRTKATFVNKSARAAVLSFQLRYELTPDDSRKWVAIPEGEMHENERLRVDAESFAVKDLIFDFGDTERHGGRAFIQSRRARLWITDHITELQALVDLPTPS